MGTRFIFALLLILISSLSFADSTPERNTHDLDSSIDKLDKINYLPNMLPVILNNKDFIGLSEQQVAELEAWRNANREPMLAAMKEIAYKRVEIKQAALSPTVSAGRLQQMQNDIFRLQRQVLNYKLSCREHIVRTFSEENWISFFMVLADENTGVSIPVNFAEK